MARRLWALLLILVLASCSVAPETGHKETDSPPSAAGSVTLPHLTEPDSPNPASEADRQGACSEAGGSHSASGSVASEEEGTVPPAETSFQEQSVSSNSQEASLPADTGQTENPSPEGSDTATLPETGEPEQEEMSVLKITVGEYELSATLEDNPSAQEFRALLSQGPVTVSMEDYGGFEKVGPLGSTLTRSDQSITTQPGDVILYQGNQITIYYGTNSWTFTRLARIDDPADLKAKLGDGTVQVTFSLA